MTDYIENYRDSNKQNIGISPDDKRLDERLEYEAIKHILDNDLSFGVSYQHFNRRAKH